MKKEGQCVGCNHNTGEPGGHCYMFKEEPKFKCMANTTLKKVGTIGHVSSSSRGGLSAMIAALIVTSAMQPPNRNEKEDKK